MFQDLRNESLGFFRKVLLQKMEPKWGDPKTKFLRLSKKTLLPIISCQFLVIFLFFCWNLLQIYCFFRFFAAKMLKMTISSSVWSGQHPNAGPNIQQTKNVEKKQLSGACSTENWWKDTRAVFVGVKMNANSSVCHNIVLTYDSLIIKFNPDLLDVQCIFYTVRKILIGMAASCQSFPEDFK